MLRSVDDCATCWTVFSTQPWRDPGCNSWRNRWHVQMPQLLTYAKMQQRSRHISTFARQSDQDDRLLGCPLGASPKLPTGDAATMTTMALVPAQVALRCHAMRWRSRARQVGRRHSVWQVWPGWPPRESRDMNWRKLALWTWHVAFWVMAVMATSSRGAPALCGTRWAPCGLPFTLRMLMPAAWDSWA